MMANTFLLYPGSAGGIGGGGGGAGGISALNLPPIAPSPFKTEDSILYDMIASRMRWSDYDPYSNAMRTAPPFQRISAHRLNDETVVVFVISNGKAVLIEDGAALFPSDALVTQLRLLAEAGK